jgi:outer membrane protein OmpA-like peptidoglycan-associated protein/tetratricopeptide (TPR) repeat protein
MVKKSTCRLLLAAAIIALPTFAQAQSKLLEKANELFQSNQFAKAAEHYQEILEKPEKTGAASQLQYVKAKLAYCLRMNNKMEQAEALYADVVQDPETAGENYYYYAEALLGNGKYQDAKTWFDKFLTIEPGHAKAMLMSASCDQVATVPSFFSNLEIEAFNYNSPADDNAPIRWKGGILFSSDRAQNTKMLKEKSGWTGRDYLNLYYCKMRADGSFSKPEVFSTKLSELNKNLSNATLSPNGREIFFTRNDNQLNQQNTYSLQLFRAISTGSDRWKDIQKLPFCNPNFNYMHPALSPDGNTLFFVSNKNGGSGGTDLWMSSKKGEDWDTPENLGPVVNTPFHEGFPFLDEQGRLFFCSKGHTSFGGYDIFVTEKDQDGQWTTPRNLGRPINGPLDDISIYLEAGGESGMFTSSRDGGDDDIYFFQAHPAAKPSSTTPIETDLTAPPALAASPPEQLEKEVPAAQEPSLPEVKPVPEEPVLAVSSSEPLPPMPNPDSSMLREPLPAQMELEMANAAGQDAEATPQETTLQEEKPVEKTAPPATVETPAVTSVPAQANQAETSEPGVPVAPPAASEQGAPLTAAPATPLQQAQPAAQEQETAVSVVAAPANQAETSVPEVPVAPPAPSKQGAPLIAAPAAPLQPALPKPETVAPANDDRKPTQPAVVLAPQEKAPAEEKVKAPATVAPPAPGQQSQTVATEKTMPAPASQTPVRKQVLENAPAPQNLGDGMAAASGSAVPQTEEMKKLRTFKDLALQLETGSASASDRFRLDNATFDPNVWQLTPKVSMVLDQLAELMRQYPAIKIELSAHTEATGPEPLNLILSQNRAGIAKDYLVKDGIAADRIVIKACGESMLLNHCADDANCTREEHLVNQRFELRILEIPERW